MGALDWGSHLTLFGPTGKGAPSHTGGVTLNPSVWADDQQLEEAGRYVHPELVELCREMGAPE